MNIEDLVPPLELCKLIPKGEFEDTAFQWQEVTIKGKVCVDIIQHYPLEWEHPEWANLYPAPTLQEVLAVCKDIATLPPDPKYTKVFDLTKLTPQNTLEIYLSKTKKEPHNANC